MPMMIAGMSPVSSCARTSSMKNTHDLRRADLRVVTRQPLAAKGRRGKAECEPVCDREPDRRAPQNRKQLAADRARDATVGEVIFGQRGELGNLDDGDVQDHDRGLAQDLRALFGLRRADHGLSFRRHRHPLLDSARTIS
jgi:hypothetical protein